MAENTTIEEMHDNMFRMYYYNTDLLGYFEDKGLEGGGDTWAGIARAALEIKSPNLLKEIKLAPEADAVYAFSKNKTSLIELQEILKQVARSDELLLECEKLAKIGGYLI